MKLQFKHQRFQADAANAVCDVFAGQPRFTPTYLIDKGPDGEEEQLSFDGDAGDIGFRNHPIVPELTDDVVLNNIRKLQRKYRIEPSPKLMGRYNLTVEMETGVGKTYTYIKTMFEMSKRYGWSKFIVVVPSVAIREGVYKSFQITQEHFAEEYGKKIRFFIYNSAQLTELDRFAGDSAINAMIINSQAFNARGKDARRIYMKLDSFCSRRPIDVLASTNPILIIDEPQSVEGAVTKEKLKEFKPLITLRYSATHKKDSVYNMVYRLDAMEAYNKRLVKKIAVKGISLSGSTATEGYLYLEGISLFKNKAPEAQLEFESKRASAPRKVTRSVTVGGNLYRLSGGMEEYRGLVVASIDGVTNSVAFTNGLTLFAGDVVGAVDEGQLRRIQIRETIKSHLERERALFNQGIKVLSLFFIDEVAKYKRYDAAGNEQNGEYADIFEDEYQKAVSEWQLKLGEDGYMGYLDGISAEKTHAGYFSIDKKTRRFVDSKLGDRKEKTSDDTDAYDLIMKNKERLLDLREPVRFVFSHSALREGWDNPNVFQICTLKQSGSNVRKRQEVGRGLRLCVNNAGERMDVNALGEDVHNINVLTVIANESYDDFARALQSELSEVVADRPREVTAELFENRAVADANGLEQIIDRGMANKIYHSLVRNYYVDEDNLLTDEYYDDLKAGALKWPDGLKEYSAALAGILDGVYNPRSMTPDNARGNNVELTVDEKKLNSEEFQELWSRINTKSAYSVEFDTQELIEKSIDALDKGLRISRVFLKVETGEMKAIKSKAELINAGSFTKKSARTTLVDASAKSGVRYDLVGKIVAETGLTRGAVVRILKGIHKDTFDGFQFNPEEFISKASSIINEQKAALIISHITYHKLDETYEKSIFTAPTLKGRLGVNAVEAVRHLYDYVIYDSKNEYDFVSELDKNENVAVYVKLPRGFYIQTPVGRYSPDWAIAFYKGTVRHVYFVAETKGDLSLMEMRKIESLKIECAKEHFRKISSDTVKYDVVSSFDELLDSAVK